MFKASYSKCNGCNDIKLVVVKCGLCKSCNEKKKKEAKVNRVVRLVNKAEKQKGLKHLIKELDTQFSIFIRRRDADENGEVKCCTCPYEAHWKKMDCGHGISRGVYATRWNEKNAMAQCGHCNAFRGGEQDKFRDECNKRFGEGTWDRLKIQRYMKYKLDRFNLQVLINYYTDINSK